MAERYELVQLKNGTWSVRSLAENETFHPVVGPVAEAEALYVRQLRLPERLEAESGAEFVVWDVGLGAAANVLTLLRALRHCRGRLRVLSFDHTLEPLRFAASHARELGYFDGYTEAVAELLARGEVTLQLGPLDVTWTAIQADFPSLIAGSEAKASPRPRAILFDAFSPTKNPAMWTLPLFTRLRQLADDEVPCALATYSRATLVRVTLLRAGWFVGIGHATGEKNETTLAANRLDLIEEPLDALWLGRAGRSSSAEPLAEPIYRQQSLSGASREGLAAHPQFVGLPE
jgi:tRNA U34 5-methylaminomethyl-2-thiouridine-forming methyltransferase MnmC